MHEEERQAVVDTEHLRILSILAATSRRCSSGACRRPGQSPPPPFVGLLFGLFGFGLFAILVVLAILKFIVARRLKEHRSRILCMIVAGVSCLGIPFGTVLGVVHLRRVVTAVCDATL